MIPLGDQASATVRGGRQELIFGSQRLVGPGDFTQVPRTFDGGAAFVKIADGTISPFWAEAVPIVQKYRFNESTSDHKLFGIFSTGPLHLLPVTWPSTGSVSTTRPPPSTAPPGESIDRRWGAGSR